MSDVIGPCSTVPGAVLDRNRKQPVPLAAGNLSRLERPAFFVKVFETTHFGTPVPRLGWAAPYPGSMEARMKLVGAYGCFRIGWPPEPAEPTVTLPRELAVEIHEAFTGGYVRDEAVRALAAAIEQSSHAG